MAKELADKMLRFMFVLYVTGYVQQTEEQQGRSVGFYTKVPMDLPYLDEGAIALAEDVAEQGAKDVHKLDFVSACVINIFPLFTGKRKSNIITPISSILN